MTQKEEHLGYNFAEALACGAGNIVMPMASDSSSAILEIIRTSRGHAAPFPQDRLSLWTPVPCLLRCDS